MSKEQTPIEQLIKKANVVGTADADVLEYLNRNKDWFIEIERYHILKILERELPNFMRWCDEGNNIEVSYSDIESFKEIAKNYIETEVKPKYQNKDE